MSPGRDLARLRSPARTSLDGESWHGVLSELDEAPALVADLPGLGRSAPTAATPLDWLTDLLAPVRTRPVIIAHSAATAPALRLMWPSTAKVSSHG
jgi:hypothetical protein